MPISGIDISIAVLVFLVAFVRFGILPGKDDMDDQLRSGFHSNDFTRHALDMLKGAPEPEINGKTKEGWEKEWGIVGAIEHLKGLGWSTYQWRFWDGAAAERHPNLTCFAEFFGPYYHGYLRGDGPDVATAVQHCLESAQKMAACQRHGFLVRYNNGLIQCRHCGFNGHSTQVETLMSQVSNLQIHNPKNGS